MEETAVSPGIRANWRALAFFALGGLIATEIGRRLVTQPPDAKGWELMYWFTDRVFFDGKWLLLLAIAAAPSRENLPLKYMAPGLGLLLMVGSFLQLQDPVFLLFVGLCTGAILKTIRLTEPALMLLALGGMLMGMPVNGFTGLMAAKANFPAPLMKALFGSTAGIGCLAIACSFTGLFLLGQLLYQRWRKRADA